MARGGRAIPQPRGRKMARGGRTRPATKRERKKMAQAGGHSHNIGHRHETYAHGEFHDPQYDFMSLSGSLSIGENGLHQHPSSIPRPPIVR